MQLADADLVAPFDAWITDTQPDLRRGDWVQKGEKLLTLINDGGGEVIAYLDESELGGLKPGAVGRFYPEGGSREPFNVRLVEIEGFALEVLENLYVASMYGGQLDVRNGEDDVLKPQRATYRIRLEAEKPSRDRVLRGQLLLEADTRSVLARFWRQAVGIWRREAGA